MIDIFTFSFMIRAFIAGIAISVIAPLIGTFVVVKRFSLIGDTLSHVALVGVAIGLLTGLHPLLTTLVVTIAAAFLIEYLRSRRHISGETVLAMLLPAGLAISLILLAVANGFNSNLFSYLFGSITTVTETDVWLILGMAAVVIVTIGVFYKQLLFVTFDEESARINGIAVERMNLLLVILTAVTVSLAMRIVGVLLIGALMVIPVVTAQQIARSFKASIVIALMFALTSVLVGLLLSYYLSLPAGAAIVLLSLLMFIVVMLFKRK
ncbi:metal ABC transporter permease [Candidatus Microgenomates bacterium]|nr:MAG: metal ABC transporter permease [Candidatus Microgenomates bacterium]